jgi:inorganic pyrophosphatase
VSSKSRNHGHLTTLDDLNENLRAEIEHFFVSYNEAKGKRFRPIGQHGPQRAAALVKAGEKAFKKARRGGRRQKGRR